jgi:hypothetical protein
MRCILVNDANLKTGAYCTQCGKPIGASYVRKIGNKFLYCGFNCYRCTTEIPVLNLENCIQPANSGTHRS